MTDRTPITAAELARMKKTAESFMPDCYGPGSTHYDGCPCGRLRLIAEVEALRAMLRDLTNCHIGMSEGNEDDCSVYQGVCAYLAAVRGTD